MNAKSTGDESLPPWSCLPLFFYHPPLYIYTWVLHSHASHSIIHTTAQAINVRPSTRNHVQPLLEASISSAPVIPQLGRPDPQQQDHGSNTEVLTGAFQHVCPIPSDNQRGKWIHAPNHQYTTHTFIFIFFFIPTARIQFHSWHSSATCG